MATTEDVLIDRVRAVLADLEFVEAINRLDFSRQPAGQHDGIFTVAPEAGVRNGGMAFTEEAGMTVLVRFTAAVNDDQDAARRTLLQWMREIVIAIVRDGAVTSGEYTVEDGRTFTIEAPAGAGYLVGVLRVPVNFEALVS